MRPTICTFSTCFRENNIRYSKIKERNSDNEEFSNTFHKSNFLDIETESGYSFSER